MKSWPFLVAVVVLLSGCASVDLAPKGGVFLGKRSVDFNATTNRIEVANYEGVFKAVQFAVQDNDIEIYNMVITFGNGETQEVQTRLAFSEGARSRLIRLEGGRRHIKSIAFSYKTIGSWLNGEAEIYVYGVR